MILKPSNFVFELLAKRISRILYTTKRERANLKKQFKELYNFRSVLVHGKIAKKQIYVGHLYIARSLVRRTLLWFLHYLKEIKEHLQSEL
ncbi:MAG: hypothetical protein JRJ62_13360 [Deltaproteobacteria bacterium]|nr:hypothetical protein [Deltaproteobacteria bacterium]MBW2089887.1 hypothetical protein [Deltaproteobacteria bacterium]